MSKKTRAAKQNLMFLCKKLMFLCPKKQTQSYVLMSKKPRAAKHNLMFLCPKNHAKPHPAF